MPATAGWLNFSRAAKADGDLAGLDDDGDLPAAVGQLEHALEGVIVFEHVKVFERNLTTGEIRTGSRSVLSEILSEDQNFFIHCNPG